MPNENLWWYDPLERGAKRGWDIVSGWGQRAGEAFTGLGETEEERKQRLFLNWKRKRDEEWAAQGKALPGFDKGPMDYSPETGVLRAKAEYMRGKDPSISIVPGVGAVQVPPKVDKDDEESEFDKYLKMKFLSEIIKRQKAPSPGYAVRAGSVKQPVAATLMSTIPQRRQRDDLLNYISGGMRGRV
jgi:hypothetical protein